MFRQVPSARRADLDSGAVIRLEHVSKTYPRAPARRSTTSTSTSRRASSSSSSASSGSGKSTFLRLLLKEDAPTAGHGARRRQGPARLSHWKVPALRRSIGCVFQDFRLLPNKTVHQNVAFALEVIGKPQHIIAQVVPEVLELVGLEGKAGRMPDELSGGEQQRVAIARAFVNRPMILLADEPTGNLDPGTSVGIMKLLDRINRTGTTVVMATHDARDRRLDAPARGRARHGQVVRDQTRGVYGYGA